MKTLLQFDRNIYLVKETKEQVRVCDPHTVWPEKVCLGDTTFKALIKNKTLTKVTRAISTRSILRQHGEL